MLYKMVFVCIFLKNFLKNVLYTKVVYSVACNIFWRLNSCGKHVEKYNIIKNIFE